jgi:hypothetical protein
MAAFGESCHRRGHAQTDTLDPGSIPTFDQLCSCKEPNCSPVPNHPGCDGKELRYSMPSAPTPCPQLVKAVVDVTR